MEPATEPSQAERHERHREMLLSHAIRKGQRQAAHAARRKARTVIPIVLR